MENLFEGFSEDQINELVRLGIIPEEQAQLEQQIAQAQAVRNRQGPQGREAGRLFVAANPLEHLGHVLEGRRADAEVSALRGRNKELLDQQAAGRKTFLQGLWNRPQQLPSEDGWGY